MIVVLREPSNESLKAVVVNVAVSRALASL
jgi:hypothetical protein